MFRQWIEEHERSKHWVMVTPADVLGSRCCNATELANLQSGSPPGGGRWSHLETFSGAAAATLQS